MICLIVDDERIARSELKYLLKEVDSKSVIYEAEDLDSALSLIENTHIDALFLDVHLAETLSIEFAEMIHEKYPNLIIVFATAFAQYAFKAYQLQAVDYILKPFNQKDIERVLLHIQEHLSTPQNEPDKSLDKISVWCGDKAIVFAYDDIQMVKADNRILEFYTSLGRYQSNTTLDTIEKKLNQTKFFRVHRSFIVNFDYVQEIIPWFNNSYALKLRAINHDPIPISRQKVAQVKKILNF